MKKKRTQLITMVSIIVTIVFYFLWPTPQKVPAQSSVNDIDTVANTVNASKEMDTHAPSLSVTRYQQCKQLIENSRAKSNNFGRSQDWSKYLNDGYSIDDITSAIDHFSNSNFAASWRDEQLKKQSQLSLNNLKINELLKNEIPDLPEDFKFKIAVPKPALESIADLTEKAALQLIKTTELSIDDVAWLVKQEELSQQVLTEAINKLDDINQMLGYDFIGDELLLLIDVAAFEGRDRVVSQLLQQHSTLSNDAYLGSTMEHALAKLSYVLGKGIEDGAVISQINIIEQLQGLNAAAFFDTQTDQSVSGSFPRHSYHFTEQQLASLSAHYQLDLTQIPARRRLAFDPDAKLIVRLSQERDLLLEKEASPEQLLSCQARISKIDKKWQPKTLNYYMTQLKNEHRVVNAINLHNIEPALAQCFMATQQTHLPFSHPRNKALESKVFGKKLRNNKILEVIKIIESANLTEAQLRWFFYQILPWDASYYQALQSSRLRQEQIDFTLLMMYGRNNSIYFEELHINGLDITGTDHTGKTLIYLSIEGRKLDLLSYLVSQRSDYHDKPIGTDPLYLVIDSSYYFNPKKVLDYLEVLMQLSPPVHDYHRRALALLRLKYPELYSQISARFGALKITDDTPLPLASCYGNKLNSG
ncbi:hypothetical protein [Shewanella sp.]|uniref:hypothetical protein n=1 Tax=Shewanella sp. TaxID=50422 RepID=UPI001ECDB44E|nr:hypothetical protein [Shewanella sp.]NRB22969.1 hypothetical protein [Shewanella sp.]